MSVLRRVNPYSKTIWYDRIIDVTTGQLLQEGTRFNQRRANNIEEGIYGAYDYIIDLESIVKRLQAQQEIDGRVPSNNGSFYDTFDGTATRVTLLTAKADITASVSAGTTVIPVSDASKFEAMTYVTLYDGDDFEHKAIASVNSGANTVTLASGVTGDYAKGAKVARTTAVVDTQNQTLDVGPFVTYDVQLVEVV